MRTPPCRSTALLLIVAVCLALCCCYLSTQYGYDADSYCPTPGQQSTQQVAFGVPFRAGWYTQPDPW